MTIGLHPEADAEFTDAIEHCAAIDRRLGRRFYFEIERSFRKILAEPDRFFQFHPPFRRALVRKFPYSVIFAQKQDRIWVLAVMHAKRKPGYWIHRLE